jgi:hypothetical protein
MQRILVTVWLLVVVGFGAPGRPSLAKPARAQGRTTPAVQVDMRNVIYHFTNQIAVHIHQLQGRVLPTPRARFPVFDDVESFTFAIAFAEIALSTETLSHILNHYVFAAPDAPLKEIAVTTTGNMRLKVQGKLHTTGGLPFTTEGTPAVTPEGSIRLRTHTITVASVPVKGLLDVLGVKLAQLINTAKVPGVRLEGNDLLLDPAQLLPPPRIAGRVTAVHVHGEQILQVFGTTPPVGAPPAHQGNYMAYRGAQLRFGKLTMAETDLVLIDLDPEDPFDFSLEHYKEQVGAGYAKMTAEAGLRVFTRDFNKLQPPPPPPPPQTRRKVPPASAR